MSLVIKDMKMPKAGRLTLQISTEGSVYIVNHCNITTETYTTTAISIPPHGRLIDADEMRDEWLINGENEYVYDTNAFLESIDNQPTVIPAEFGGAEGK